MYKTKYVPIEEFNKLQQENDMIKKKIKKFVYFTNIPNLEDFTNIKGINLCKHLGINDERFLQTLNILNYFVDT